MCLGTLENEIHFKLQRTCYTLQSLAANYNGFKNLRQSLQKVELSSTLSNRWKP